MLIVLHYEAHDLDRFFLCLIVASQLIEIPKEGIQNLNRLVVTARTALPDARPIFFEAHFEAIDTESMDILGRGELTIKQRLRSESQSPRRDRSHRPPRCQTDLL